MRGDPRARYGPWAVVAGASEGIGRAFAEALAERGLDCLLVARREGPLEEAARAVRARGRAAHTARIDLARPDAGEAVAEAARGLEVGCLVHNAAHSRIGPFLEQPAEELVRILEVNARSPLLLAHAFAGPMAARGRGGIVLVSSLAGFQGSPLVAPYAATKAFERVLAEGLWEELRGAGVDVVACCAGATRTPRFEASRPRGRVRTLAPRAVAEAGLRALGRRPVTIPGIGNRAAAWLLGRALPRSLAVRAMGRATRRLYGASGSAG